MAFPIRTLSLLSLSLGIIAGVVFFSSHEARAAQVTVPTTPEEAGQYETREEMILDAINFAKPLMPDADALVKQAIEGYMQIYSNPPSPGPNENVVVSVRSSDIDLAVSTISWYINDTLIDKAAGEQDFTFRTGALGSTAKVLAIITAPDGKSYQKDITFRPASVELAWEALTYTPPFYQGKALATPGSTLKIVAIPHFVGSDGREIAPQNLAYTWTRNDEGQPTSSGLGKFVFYSNGPGTYIGVPVKVKVYTPDGGLTAEATLTINPSQPEVLFYEESPLAGVEYGHALSGTVSTQDSEMTLRAEPYFFSQDGLSFAWSLDNATLPAATSTTMTFSSGGSINAVFQNLTHGFQTVSSSLKLNVGGGGTASSF